ncbi:helix-turn-helix domain containing protein [Blastococcus sp. TF02-09]|nr:helix-turn-helix domain containing protein [Blastococcus sp. TF02-9]
MAPYPPRPQLRPLPEFVGTNVPRPDPAVQQRVEQFVLSAYAAGRSLREIAELTNRSHSAIRNILDKRGMQRRLRGAGRVGDGIRGSSYLRWV